MSRSKDVLSHWVPVFVLIVTGIALFVSLVLALFSLSLPLSFPASGALTLPGAFLFQSFSWASLYIPLYFFLNAFVLRRFSARRVILLMLSIIPFFTLSLFFKVALDNGSSGSFIIAGLKGLFGSPGSEIAVSLYTVLEIVLLLVVGRFLGKKNRESKSARFVPIMNGNREQRGTASVLKNREKQVRTDRMPRENSLLLPQPARNESAVLENEEDGEPMDDEQDADDEEADFDTAFPPARAYEEKSAGASRGQTKNPDMIVLSTRQESTAGENGNKYILRDDGITEKKSDFLQKRKTDTVERSGDKKGPVKRFRGEYRVPIESVLKEYGHDEYWKIDRMTQKLGETLKKTLEEFNIIAEVTGIRKGPVITMFEILPAPGVKLSKIVNLADNIALRLAASRVRIVAPIPGKQAVGIEVPNKHRSIVSLREVISDPVFLENKTGLPIALGKDITGHVEIADLTQMPHLLIAGATGSGKSVCVNSIICSILFNKSPDQVRLLLIDPKIVELKYFNDIPHLLTPVITEPKRAYQALQYCIAEMERRYSLLDALCVRDIAAYNRKVAKKTHTVQPLPHIVVVIDEFADLIATTGKDMESTLARLAAMSRAVGIHIVLATQRPSIDIITGLIKANIPTRIAFMVAGKFDSRIIIDAVGAEKLLGQGDMLFLSAQNPFPVRIQGAYISDEEVEALVEYVKGYGEPDYIDDEIFIDEDSAVDLGLGELDPLLEHALDIVLAAGKASTSYIQRKLKIGYNRAARLIEEMEIRGIVGPANGSKARDIIHVPSKPR